MVNREIEPLGIGGILDAFHGFQLSLALRTAIELDLFTHIASGAATSARLAGLCNASERGLRILCDSLTVHGYILKQRGRYSLPLHSRIYLTPASPAYIGLAARFLVNDRTVAAFCRLRQAVKKGSAANLDALSKDDTAWVEFANYMAPLARPVAEASAKALRISRRGSGEKLAILDLAAGHGHYGIALASRHPGAQIYALDSPRVLKVAVNNARKAGVSDRYHTIPGDAFKASFGGPYDCILAANIAHHLSESANVVLFRKCVAALKPGGNLVLIEFLPNADRVSPAADAVFALTLLATTKEGDAYTFAQYSRMLREAGLRQIRRAGQWIVTACSPGRTR